MKISQQVKRVQERKQRKEKAKLIKQLQLSDFIYLADDKNMTFSAMGSQLVDFMNIIGLPRLFKEHVLIDKKESAYHSNKLSQLFVLQNILGCDRIESSRPLNQDTILKDKSEIDNYPDPETFLR